MALFGDDMMQVTTPDGRQITVPSQLAAQFPGLTPVIAPPAPPALAPQDFTPPPVAPPPPDPALITSPTQVPAPGPAVAPVPAPVTAPDQLPDAGPPNPPKPTSNADLAKAGNAGVYNAQTAAIDTQRAAVQQVGKAQADEATAVGAKMAAADAETQRLLEQRKAAADQLQSDLAAKQLDIQTQAKAIADTKIDREVDHPVLAAIGLVLGGLSSALNRQQGNPAMDMLLKQIDRKVAAQMQDIDKRRADLGTQRELLGAQRAAGQDRLSEMDTYRLGYIEQAKRQIETIKQQSSSAIVKANADSTLAGLNKVQADTMEGAVGREQARLAAEQARKDAASQHAATIGVALRGQNLEQKRFEEQLKVTQQEKADALAEKYAALGEKDKAAKAKGIGELGVWDPRTGDTMVTPEGQRKLAQADQFEAKARDADSETAQKLNVQAQALRESAHLNDAVVAPTKEAAEKLRPIVIASQAITDKLQAAKEMLQADPSLFDRDKWAQMRTDLGAAQGDYAKLLGERVSPKAIDAVAEHIFNFDPGNLGSRVASRGKALASIDQLQKIVTQGADAELKGNGVKSGWTPSTPKADLKIGGDTAQEIGAAAEPGTARGAAIRAADFARDVGRANITPLGAPAPDGTRSSPQAAAENTAGARVGPSGQRSNYGLDPKDDATIRDLIRRAGSVGHTEHDQIISTLTEPLKGTRPSLTNGVADLLRDENPKLFAEVLQRMPDKVQAKAIADRADLIEQGKEAATGKPHKLPPAIVQKLTPEGLKAYNAYLKSKGFPEVSP